MHHVVQPYDSPKLGWWEYEEECSVRLVGDETCQFTDLELKVRGVEDAIMLPWNSQLKGPYVGTFTPIPDLTGSHAVTGV